jgi:hypothetical protein
MSLAAGAKAKARHRLSEDPLRTVRWLQSSRVVSCAPCKSQMPDREVGGVPGLRSFRRAPRAAAGGSQQRPLHIT